MAFNTNPGRQEFTASALQTDFIFNFKIFTTTDVNVYKTPSGQLADDTADLLTIGTDYNVAIDGDNGGTVTLTSGASADDAITIVRRLPITRDYDYQQSGDLYADTLDLDQEYQTYLIADRKTIVSRSLVLPEAEQMLSTILPSTIKGSYLKVNDGGTAFEYGTQGDFTADTIKETLADLRESTTLPETVWVSGYHTKNDGAFGSNIFRWNPTSIEDDNGGTIIKLDSIATGRYELQFEGAASVKYFGAGGNNEIQDTLAFTNIVASGLSILIPKGTYSLSDALVTTLTDNLTIVSEDAQINFTNVSVLENGIDLSLNGFNLFISGVLNIDFNYMTNKGLYIRNDDSPKSIIDIDQLNIEKIKKTDINVNCNGIDIAGFFDDIYIANGSVKNVLLGSGTGVSGSSGVGGITINKLANDETPLNVRIDNYIIENIKSEDTTYTSDQDGVRIFGPEDEAGVLYPNELMPYVTNSKFKNCMGRSVKFQTEQAEVSSCFFRRDVPLDVDPWGIEVDFQTGGGYATDLTFNYINGSVPTTVILVNTPELDNKEVPSASIKGLKVYSDGMSPDNINAIVNLSSRSITNENSINISDINMKGNANMAVRLSPTSGGVLNANINNIVGNFMTSLVRAEAASGSGMINVSNIINTGSKIPLLTSSSGSATYALSVVNSINFETTNRIAATAVQGIPTRIDSIVPYVENSSDTETIKSGLIRPVSFTLEIDEIYELPKTAYNVNTGMITVSVGGNRNDQAILAYDSAQVLIIAGGSSFEAGTTTEPTSGTYRVWTGTDNIFISNRSTATRTFTCLMMG